MQENNPVTTPIVTPPVLVEQPKPNNFLVILLSILLFISVVIAGFFAYQTQKLVKELNNLKSDEKIVSEVTPEPTTDPTANWKTYTNKTYLYSVNYPNDWFVDSLKDNEVNISNYNQNDLTDQEKKDLIGNIDNGKFFHMTLGVYDGAIVKGTSLLSWLKNNDLYVSAMSGTPTSEKETTIAGNIGLILNYEGTGPFYVFIAKSKVYYAYFGPDGLRSTKLFDQIISTFKFIN